HIGETRLHLHHLVESRQMLVGARKIALQLTVDEARVDRPCVLPADPQPVHDTGREVLEKNIAPRDQTTDHVTSLGPLEVDAEALLVAVEAAEKADGEVAETPGPVSTGVLGAVLVGPEIGKHQAAARIHDRVAKVKHPNAGERQDRLGRICTHLICSKAQLSYSGARPQAVSSRGG